MWRRLSERERKMAALLVATLVLAAFHTYLLSPQLEALGRIRQEAAAVERELERAERIITEVPVEREALAGAEAELDRLRHLFADTGGDGALVIEVGLRALDHGVDVTLFQPRDLVEGDLLSALPVEIGIRGAYPDVLSFMKSIQNLSQVSEMRRIVIRDERDEPGGWVRADFLLVIYFDPSLVVQVRSVLMGQWAAGRHNAFEPIVDGAPAPGSTALPAAPRFPPLK